jgi:hypothetical protein
MKRTYLWALAVAALGACSDGDGDAAAKAPEAPIQTAQADSGVAADLPPVVERELTPEELERGRNSDEWSSVVQLDTTGGGVAVRNPEKWEMITTEQVNTGATFLPLSGDVGGPSVYRVQILLDRALFSPGMMDGAGGRTPPRPCTSSSSAKGCAPPAAWTPPPTTSWPKSPGAPSSSWCRTR